MWRMARGNDLVRVLTSTHPRYPWRTTWTEGRRRLQSFHITKAEAEASAREVRDRLRNHGAAEEAVSKGERAAVLRWRELAQDLDIPGEVRLVDVVEDYARRYRECIASKPLSAAAAAYIEHREREDKSKRHLMDLRSRLARLVADIGGERMLTDITPGDVDAWLLGLGVAAQTRLNYRRVAGAMFNFAMERGWATENPVKKSHKVKVPEPSPEIFTVAEARALLRWCHPSILPAVVLGLFSGLRTTELHSARWEHIDLAQALVTVPPKKKNQTRHAPITAPGLAWLAPLHEGAGPVLKAPSMLHPKLREAAAAMGIDEWPDNGMRHSFASYRLADVADAGRIALEMGNSPTVLLSRYRQLVTPADAAAYFGLRPEGQASNVVPMVAKG